MKKITDIVHKTWLQLCLAIAFGFMPHIVLAAPTAAGGNDCGTPVGTPGLDGICKAGGGGLNGLINGVANWLTGLLSLVVVLIIIVAGVQMISSAGNSEAVKAARGRLTNAIIGLVTLIAMRLILTLLGVIK